MPPQPPKKRILSHAEQELQKKRLAAAEAAADVISAAAARGKDKIPHLRETLEAMMASWGGLPGFVRRLKTEYEQARPGSIHRFKILDRTMRLITLATQMGVAENTGDTTAMSDDDLKRGIGRLLMRSGLVEKKKKPPPKPPPAP